jgi:hypothetical protein
MIITLAGRRIDAADAKEERFPLRNADRVAEEIQSRLKFLGAGMLVCSAACGADLIALKASRKLGVRSRIVLPFAPGHFRQTSVIDCPGNSTWDWGSLFDEFIKKANDTNDLIVLPLKDSGTGAKTAAYVETNQRLITEALNLSRAEVYSSQGDSDKGQTRAMIIWEGGSRGEVDLTAEFAERAQQAGMLLEEVKTI